MADESVLQTVKRNITPEVDTSNSAKGPGHEFEQGSPQAEGEQQYKEKFGSLLEQAYGHAKSFLATHEQHLSEKVLKPFRQGLDNMAEDLQNAAESGTTKSGGQMTPVTRALAAGAGAALKAVPVGSDVKSTAAGLITPPELGTEEKAALDFSKLEGHTLIEEAPVTAYRARPVGERGVAAGERPVATSSLEKAQTYKENLETMTGKPHEVVHVPVKAGEHVKHTTNVPDGETWYSFKKDVPEESVKIHGEKTKGEEEPEMERERRTRTEIKRPVEKPSPKDVVEKAGLVYKGELTKGSGVHQFEHPDHPGKTAALNKEQLTPENVKQKMNSKIKEFEAAKKATDKGSENLGNPKP